MSESARDTHCPACGEWLWPSDDGLSFLGHECECTACETLFVIKSDFDDETGDEVAYLEEVDDE